MNSSTRTGDGPKRSSRTCNSVPRTDRIQPARGTNGSPGKANGASMLDHPVAEHDPLGRRQSFVQIAFDGDRFRFFRQAQTERDSLHVRIDDDPGGNLKTGADNDVSRLTADSRKPRQRLEIGGNPALVMLDQPSRHSDQAFRLRAKKSRGLDQFLHLGRVCLGERCGIGKSGE